MIIDVHSHMGKGRPKAPEWDREQPVDLILKFAKEAGVDKTVILSVSYDDYRQGHREIYEAVRAHPDKLIGFARINPNNPRALNNLREGVEKLGLKGMKIHPGLDKVAVLDERVSALLDLSGELKIPALFDARTKPGPMGLDRSIPSLIRMAQAHTGTNIIFAHIAGEVSEEDSYKLLNAARGLPNIHFDISRSSMVNVLRDIALEMPERLLFGSDSPDVHPKVALDVLKRCNLSEAIEQKILWENAMRLLGL